MKILVSAFAIPILCLVAGAVALYAASDFSGTWILDQTKSDSAQQTGRGMGRLGGGFPGGGRPEGGRFPGARGAGGFPVAAGPPPGAEVTLSIVQTPEQISLTRTWMLEEQERSATQTHSLSGRESSGTTQRGSYTSVARWKKETLVIESSQSFSGPNGEMQIQSREEYALSDGGQTLTIKITRSTPMGEIALKQIYRRQQ